MGKPNRGQKRKATYYKQHGAKKSKVWSKLDAGMRGVLITCNKREKEAIREAYNLLNEYADKLYGPEKVSSTDFIGRVGKFDPKVGNRRKTKIKNLAILVIILVALICYVVLVFILLFLLVRER